MSKYRIWQPTLFLLCSVTILGIICLSVLKTPEKTPINYATGDSHFGLTDDSYFFMIMGEDATRYYRQYLYEDKLIEVGAIEPFYLSTRSVMLDKSIFISIATLENDRIKNSLYKIDIDKNELVRVSTDDTCRPDAYAFVYDNNIAILKYSFGEKIFRSFIDVYNPETNQLLTEIITDRMDNTASKGSTILQACSDNGYLYAFTRNKNGTPDVSEGKLVVYNQNFELVNTISISNIAEYIMGARVYQLSVKDNFVFLSNMSNDSVFGEIEQGNITPLLQEKNLEIASMSPRMILYIRGTNQILQFDPMTRQFNKISVDIPNNYSIRTVLAHDNHLLVVLKSDYYDDMVRLITLDR